MPHPLSKFEQYVDKKGSINDYIKSFGITKGLTNYYFCRIRRSGIASVFYNACGDKCWLRSGSADVMVFEQVFIFDDYDIDFRIEPEFIIDAGAHIGLAALYFLDRFPHAQIVCLEPEAENFGLLNKNVKHLSNIKSFNCALWHFSGEVFLENPNASTWAFRVSERPSDVVVATMDINTILDENQQSKVHLLKVDIEGSEKPLFARKPSWANKLDYLVIETHDHIQPGASAAVEKALTNEMQLIQHQGENWVYARNEIAQLLV